jgi:hypothetical protein
MKMPIKIIIIINTSNYNGKLDNILADYAKRANYMALIRYDVYPRKKILKHLHWSKDITNA